MHYFSGKLFKWNFSEQNVGNNSEKRHYDLMRVRSDIPADFGKK